MNYLSNSEKPFIALIGRNGAGKSYILNRLMEENPEKTLYISEEGIARVAYQKNNININFEGNKYIYIDEKGRGSNSSVEEYIINDNALKVVEYCNSIKSKMSSSINKSQGQKKLVNIMDIFLRYNFNNIDTILFDEPENFLDEEYLKLVSNLINVLNINGFRVRIATHNSRFLSILEIDIDDIVFLINRETKRVSKDDIKSLFRDIASKVESICEQNSYTGVTSMMYKLKIADIDDVFDSFVGSKLKSVEFYSSLFYRNIIVVEGESDLEALKTINERFEDTWFVLSANGKVWIPFYVKLFTLLQKKITVIIDRDTERQAAAYSITKLLFELDSLNVIEHDPDMETEYGINVDEIGERLGMSSNNRKQNRGWLKQLAAYYFFSVQGNWMLLNQKINGNLNEVYDFE